MKRLLIVDDIPQNLYLLEVLLKTNGFDVEKAANGIEALDLARKNPPEMIISDILMPGMDGFSLCRAWKADERLKAIPFVFYTATYTDPRDEKFAMSLGAERFIVKPMDPDDFLTTLQEIIQNHEANKSVAQQEITEKEEEFYKEYSETLIRKLEDKMMQLQKSNKRLASLFQVSCDLHSMKPSADLINMILRALVETAGYRYASYYNFNESQNTLSLLAASGFSENTLKGFKDKLVFNLGEEQGLVGQVAQNEQTITIADTSKEPNWIDLDPAIKSALFTPVHFEKVILGVFALFSKEKNAFTEEDEHDITVLANNLAIGIENARNQERVKKQLTRISALHNIDLAINSSMDLHTTLNIFLEHVTTQLKIDAADVLLSRLNASTHEFTAGRGFNTREIGNNSIRTGKSLDKKVALKRGIIHVTGLTDQEVSPSFTAMCAAEGFSTYLGAPLIAKGKVVGVLEIFHRTPFDPDPEWIDYFKTLAGQAAIAIDNALMFTDLQRSNLELSVAYDATIKGWSRAMDIRDQETEGHTQRVTEMTVRLAEIMRISDEQIVHIRRGALLHDIGKLGVPDAILLKPGKLTDEEWIIMRKHPQVAYDMLLPIDYLRPALDIPYCHHEKWDGTGYPRGLKGESIPLAARLFAIVDVWDALCSNRPYRPAWSKEKALEYIQSNSGSHFEPQIVNLFIESKVYES
ncbi:MAG: HD domain-containing phosphohydrolase [Anaerolineaceae bacterium]|jgi:response regulator RpfG family c-di-GMP phosphodiesterase